MTILQVFEGSCHIPPPKAMGPFQLLQYLLAACGFLPSLCWGSSFALSQFYLCLSSNCLLRLSSLASLSQGAPQPLSTPDFALCFPMYFSLPNTVFYTYFFVYGLWIECSSLNPQSVSWHIVVAQ